MVENLAVYACISVAAWAIYWAICTILSHRHHARRSQELGCRPAPTKPDKLIFGIDSALDLNKADKAHKVPQEVLRIFEEMKCETFNQSFFGTPIVMTYDPKNVQAVLAKQFHDFELGEERRNNFFPMLGLGIFTADGKVWYVTPINVSLPRQFRDFTLTQRAGSIRERCCDPNLHESRYPTSI